MRERLRRLDGDVGKFALKAASAKVRCCFLGCSLVITGKPWV